MFAPLKHDEMTMVVSMATRQQAWLLTPANLAKC